MDPEWLPWIANGPQTVRSYRSYLINGYKFVIQDERELERLHDNSGVYMVGATPGSDGAVTGWYGTLLSIYELVYCHRPRMSVVVFRCRWFDPSYVTTNPRCGLTTVNKKKLLPLRDDPFILATSARQTYYAPLPGSARHRATKDLLAACQVRPTSLIVDNTAEHHPFQEDGPVAGRRRPRTISVPRSSLADADGRTTVIPLGMEDEYEEEADDWDEDPVDYGVSTEAGLGEETDDDEYDDDPPIYSDEEDQPCFDDDDDDDDEDD